MPSRTCGCPAAVEFARFDPITMLTSKDIWVWGEGHVRLHRTGFTRYVEDAEWYGDNFFSPAPRMMQEIRLNLTGIVVFEVSLDILSPFVCLSRMPRGTRQCCMCTACIVATAAWGQTAMQHGPGYVGKLRRERRRIHRTSSWAGAIAEETRYTHTTYPHA